MRTVTTISIPGLLAAGVLLSFAYFYQAGGWNQNSRYDLTRAIVERGTVRIDAYHQNTGDKARLDEHFYSDKAPGQSFLAIPIAAASDMLFGEPAGERATARLTYAMTVATSALPAALCALVVMALARRHGRSRAGALFATVVLCLGTPLWAYATLFMGHALAAACLALGLAAAAALGSAATPRRQLCLGLAVGLSTGWAVLTEYPAVLPAAALAGFALWQVRADRQARWRAGLGLAAGAALCIAILLGYHQLAFGSPLETPLRHLYLFRHVREQPFSAPSPAALGAIFFGAKRGLLPLSPVLAVGLVGLYFMWRDASSRALAIVCASIIGYYALFNASFATPLAGWSYGPRYMAAALPFWAVPLMWLWDRYEHRAIRGGLVVLALWGIACALIAVSTTAQPPESYARPLVDLLVPAFLDGDLSLNHQSFLEAGAHADRLRGGMLEHDAFNLGELMGLRGLLSLTPLLAMWLGVAAIVWRRRSATTP